MLNFLKNTNKVFNRELKIISKDFNLITILILAPLFYSFFYGSIYFNKIETEVAITIVDMDKSKASKKLISNLDSHQSIKVVSAFNDYSEGIYEINSLNTFGLVYIPKDYEKGLKNGKGSDIKLYLNTTKFLVSNDINKAVNEVVMSERDKIKLKFFKLQGFNTTQAEHLIEPIRISVKSLYNTTESYGDFLIPAILILIIQQTLLIGLSESMAKEQEFKTLKSLYKTSNYSIVSIIKGKGLFYFLLFLSYFFLFHTINYNLFSLPFRGEFFSFTFVTILFLTSIISFTFFISTFFARKILAVQFLSLSSYPIFLLSGYSFPLNEMPIYLQFISSFLPSTAYYNVYTKTAIMGGGFSHIPIQLIHLIILNIFWFFAAYYRINKNVKQLS